MQIKESSSLAKGTRVQTDTTLNKEIKKLIPNIDLKGRYSLDIMKSGDDFYLIDMALMSESALSELLPQYMASNNQTLLN